MDPPFSLATASTGRAGTLELPLSGLGDDAGSKRALALLRNKLIPQTLGQVPGVQVAITGDAAHDIDFTRQGMHGLSYVIASVLVLAFLSGLLGFRARPGL